MNERDIAIKIKNMLEDRVYSYLELSEICKAQNISYTTFRKYVHMKKERQLIYDGVIKDKDEFLDIDNNNFEDYFITSAGGDGLQVKYYFEGDILKEKIYVFGWMLAE